MSGWIKLEKDRRDDPRVLRMARQLRDAGVTHERFTANAYVTLVLGGLDQLWIYADTHVREDDTLDLGTDEIDELVGIKGFCGLLPPDWLEVIDANRVKLPDFHAHNGTESKRKALGQKRSERYRNAEALQANNGASRNGVTGASLDQTKTRPDQTRPEKKVPTEPVSQSSTAVERVFEHWKTTHGHPKATIDLKRTKKIREALKAYSEADVCMAITGYLNSPHHMGENDRNTKFTDLELLIRDAAHIDAGIKFYENPPAPKSKAQISQDANVSAGVEWLRRTHAGN